MPAWHIPNSAVAGLLLLAVLGFMAPHLLILGFKAAGAPPPAALVFLCPLDGGGPPATRGDARPVHIGDRRPGSSRARVASWA
jgi:hypothetical protein